MKNIIVLTFASILLQGCLGKKNEITEDVVFLQSVPVCNTPEMCKKMWDAAGEWVDKYSPQGIDTYTDDMIRSEDKDNSSDEMEIVIKRIKQGNASYKILIDTICTNSISSCSLERNNMLAFNKKLIGFMSVKEKTKKEKVFDANAALNLWLKHY
ncbi:MAG: hypothetical protein KAQ67_04965, partial [Gammaproteobacteria bacterium]|nr:hypothetical protein [Gammaproteobacteria bacterium]